MAGKNHVTFAFNQPGASVFTQLAGVYIVPKHIWSKQADPTKFTNATKPVGTGPYRVAAFRPDAEPQRAHTDDDEQRDDGRTWNEVLATDAIESGPVGRRPLVIDDDGKIE